MTNIYEKHDKAFYGITACVIARSFGGEEIERLATISFTRNQRSGNVRCFFHFLGYQMQQGSAGGGGYDKMSAAFYDATQKHLKLMGAMKEDKQNPGYAEDVTLSKKIFQAAKEGNGGSQWADALRKAGFNVLQAI